jgi:membrane associated rhomboid family serine protease
VIDDRDYMREPEFGSSRWSPRFGWRWSLTVGFLIAYATVFLAEKLSPQIGKFFQDYLALNNEGLAHGYVWQLVTYQFMHANFLHLFFNGWAIYALGTELEEQLGRGRFTALMLSSGIIGGVFQALLTWLSPRLFPDTYVVGASACAFGLVAAYAFLFPERELTMFVFFVIPVTVAAKMLLLVSAAMAAIGVVVGIYYPTHMANAAHLGGMAMGWFFVRCILRTNWNRLSSTMEPERKSRWRQSKPEPDEMKDDTAFLQNQVDAILDKITASGIKSLTTREREILESARKKMTRS